MANEFNITEIKEKTNGSAFYDIQYITKTKVISVSYENIEDYFQVIVFKLQDGQMPNYDDKIHTLHSNYLNKLIAEKVTPEDFKLNNESFSNFKPKNEFERNALKSSKDLRLALKLLPTL